MTSETYPSGRVVTTNYDLAGRISQVSGVKGAVGTTYASSFSYTAHGAVGSLTLGNGLIESAQFNNRLQPTNISLGSLLSLTYNYGSTNNNGNVLSMTITPGTGQTPISQAFTYDALNRLQSGTETASGSQTWKQTNGFDQYGNRWIDSLNTTGNVMGPISSQADVSTANNRIVKAGYSYDAAGNMTAEPGKVYTFDAENKIATANVGGAVSTYVYDGDGRRVKKVTPSGTIVMVYDASSRLIAEYADTPPAGPGGTEYATADHLGTPRVWTNSSGQVVTGGRHDYLPFGEELFSGLGSRSVALSYPPSAQSDGQRNQFTSKERDNETNLDYFLARYYSSAHGRFISPDEFGGGPVEFFAAAASANPTFYADLTNPQTLNKYQYSFNNPLRYVDPDGHDPEDEKTLLEKTKEIAEKTAATAVQVSKDLVNGTVKELANSVDTAANLVSQTTNLLISPFTDFRFQEIPLRQPSTPGEQGTMLGIQAGSLLIGAGEIRGAATLAERAEQVQGVLGAITRTKTTTAVVEAAAGDGSLVRVVAFSERALRPAQRAALRAGEIAVAGEGHAEVTAINGALKMGHTPLRLAASRPVCAECVKVAHKVGVLITTPLKK